MTRLAGFIIILLLSFNAHASAGYVSQGGLTWMPIDSSLMNWKDANAYCADSAINGQNGWRLPSKDELIALRASGAMKGQGWELDYTWSSTPGSAGEHYYVVLGNSIVESYKDTYSKGYFTCVKTNSAEATPPAKSNSVPPAKPKPAQAPKTNGGLQLIVTDNRAEKAVAAKAQAKAEKKEAAEREKQQQATEKRFAEEKKARDATEAKRKAEFKIVTSKDYDYQLNERTAKTWCQNSQQRLRKSYSTGRNQLVSVGECRCTPPKERMNPLDFYKCEYPFTVKEFMTISK